MAVKSKRPRLNGIVNRIRLVGIELEGGWDKAPAGEDIQKDGSVKFPGSPAPSLGTLSDSQIREAHATGRISTNTAQRMFTENMLRAQLQPLSPSSGPAYKGEIVSKPIPVEKVEAWVAKCYPQHINETCGLHVHMSFHHRTNYARLMTPDFTPFIVDKVREWAETEKLPADHPQWERLLKRDHPHCAHQYLADGQVKMTRKDFESRGKSYSRYTFVNYCDGQHHTIEVRGLSMPPTAEMATRAIMVVVNGTNEFLSKIRQREPIQRVKVTTKSDVEQTFRTFARAA